MSDSINEEVVSEEEITVEETVEPSENQTSALVEGVMHEQNIKNVSNKQAVMKILVQVGLYAFLGIMAFIILFPFYLKAYHFCYKFIYILKSVL